MKCDCEEWVDARDGTLKHVDISDWMYCPFCGDELVKDKP